MTSDAVERIILNHEGEMGALISILEDIQDRCHYLPEEALKAVADKTGRSLKDVYGIATFYKAFSLKPRGRHLISVCLGTACHVRSAAGIVDEFKMQLGLNPGETSKDGEFTLETVNCLGTCALGPIVAVDGRFFSNVARSDVKKIISKAREDFKEKSTGNSGDDFPVEILCPHCNQSLIDKKSTAGSRNSIIMNVSVNGMKSQASISRLLGPVHCMCEHDIPQDSQVSYSCPNCLKKIEGKSVCVECGSAMAPLPLGGGGLLQVCTRWGCANSEIDMIGSGSHDKPSTI